MPLRSEGDMFPAGFRPHPCATMLCPSFIVCRPPFSCHAQRKRRRPMKCCANPNDPQQDGSLEDESAWKTLQQRLEVVRDKEVHRDRTLAHNWRTGNYKSSVVAAVTQDFVRKISLSDDFLAMGTARGSVVLSDLSSGRRLTCRNVHSGQVTALDFRQGLLASAGSVDHAVAVWKCDEFQKRAFWTKLGLEGAPADGDLPEPNAMLKAHDDVVTTVRIDVAKNCVYSASADGTVRVYDIESGTGKMLARIGEPVLCMVLTEKGYLLLGCASGRVQAYEAKGGLYLFSIVCHEANTTAIDFCEETQVLATADSSGNIKLWSFEDSSLLGHLPNHGAAVMSLQLDTYKAVSASRDGSVAVSTLDSLQRRYTIRGFTKYLAAATFDEVRLLADGTNNVVVCHRFDAEDKDAI